MVHNKTIIKKIILFTVLGTCFAVFFLIPGVALGATPHIYEVKPNFHLPPCNRVIKITGSNFNSSAASENKIVFKKGSYIKEKLADDIFYNTLYLEISPRFFVMENPEDMGEWKLYVYSHSDDEWIESDNYKIFTVTTHCEDVAYCCPDGYRCDTGIVDCSDCDQCCLNEDNCIEIVEPTCAEGDGCKSGCSAPGDPDCTCTQNGGTWCGTGKNCTGATLYASDHPKAECCQYANDCPGGNDTPITGCPTKGLVPCGTPGCPCQLCHLFVMFDNIIDFLLLPPDGIIFIIAVLMLVIGGVMFIFGSGSPAWITRGKSIMTSVAIGLVLVYAAWLIIGLFFQVIGLNDWTEDIYRNWWEEGFFEVPCD